MEEILKTDEKVIDIYLDYFIARYGLDLVEQIYLQKLKEKREQDELSKESGTSGNT